MTKTNILVAMLVTLITSSLANAEVCTFSDSFSVTDAKPKFTQTYKNLRFQKGQARISLKATNSGGNGLSGEVIVEQQNLAQYNSNLAFPASGFGGTFVTPTNESNFAQVDVKRNAVAHLRIAFGQNGNGMSKTGKYTITVSGDAVTSCGGDDEAVSELPRELRTTRVVRVPGRSGLNWVDTGIVVRKNEWVVLSSTGKVDVNAGWGIHDAFGTTNFADLPGYPLNSRRRYGLVARINGQRWAYGPAQKALSKGRLYLTCNDDAPDNNTGEFVVTIKIYK